MTNRPSWSVFSLLSDMNIPVKKICLMALFITIGISLGFAFAHIPNIEFITATIFLSGYFLGLKEGLIVGMLTEGLYSFLSPFGMAAPPLFFAQIISMGITGLAGALFYKYQSINKKMYPIQLGLIGFAVTLLFAVLTTLSFVLFIEFSTHQLIGSFLFGMGFYLIHLITNILIFTLLVPQLINVLKKLKVFSYRQYAIR